MPGAGCGGDVSPRQTCSRGAEAEKVLPEKVELNKHIKKSEFDEFGKNMSCLI